jgi:hypothetical protein
MTQDSDLFEDNTKENLEERGFQLNRDYIFSKDDTKYLPLYEAKFIQQFDHRFGTFHGVDKEGRFKRRAGTKRVGDEEKNNPNYEILPRYWVKQEELEQKRSEISWDNDWIFAFRNIVRVGTDTRTSVGTIIPFYPTGNSAPVLTFKNQDAIPQEALMFTSIFTSIPFDFMLRQSLGGTNLNLYILKQLPMPTPDSLRKMEVIDGDQKTPIYEYILDRALELVWTSHSLDPLGEDIRPDEGPFKWDTSKRRDLRRDIDTVIAKAYGINRDDLSFIFDRFEILKQKEENEFGRYQRKEECLKKFDDINIVQNG